MSRAVILKEWLILFFDLSSTHEKFQCFVVLKNKSYLLFHLFAVIIYLIAIVLKEKTCYNRSLVANTIRVFRLSENLTGADGLQYNIVPTLISLNLKINQ